MSRDVLVSVVLPVALIGDMQTGLRMLWRARLLAEDLHESPWTLAVDIQELREAGISRADLQWLLRQGMIEHAIESTKRGNAARRFDPVEEPIFDVRSCFILTAIGLKSLERLLHTSLVQQAQRNRPFSSPTPEWDAQIRELRLGDEVLKRFRVPACNQQLILSAFEEEGWPAKIDDPLPRTVTVHSKPRLHAAIQSLNRNQRPHRIRFRGNGKGDGILWELA